jgi:hypothetical protein
MTSVVVGYAEPDTHTMHDARQKERGARDQQP